MPSPDKTMACYPPQVNIYRDFQIKLTTPYAVLAGFGLAALAIASLPFTSQLVPVAHAQSGGVLKVVICNMSGARCADIDGSGADAALAVAEQYE